MAVARRNLQSMQHDPKEHRRAPAVSPTSVPLKGTNLGFAEWEFPAHIWDKAAERFPLRSGGG